jgi:hypothetical protein
MSRTAFSKAGLELPNPQSAGDILLLCGKAVIAIRRRNALSKLSEPILGGGRTGPKVVGASVSALLAEMIEKNRKALELELGNTVR